MNLILKYHFFQLYNFWRQLGLRIQIEIAILLIIFYTIFTDKLIYYFNQLLDKPDITTWGLNGFVVHALLILALFSTPFIYFSLIPKQKGLKILGAQPLSGSQALTSLILYYLKYELILIFLAVPAFTALSISTGIFPMLYGFSIFIAFSIYSLIIIHILSIKSEKRSLILFKYFLLCSGYFVLYFYLYWNTEIAVYGDIVMMLLALFILGSAWRSHWHTWDQIIGRMRPALDRSAKKLTVIQYSSLSNIRPESIRPLFIKEFLSQFRNKHYMRLKILSLLIYISALLIIEVFFSEHFIPALSVISFFLIWEHYSHQFNEKYAGKEPHYFYKVLPLRFYQVIFAKFISEFLYILIIILVLSIFLTIHGLPLLNILIFLGMVFTYSVFILYLMILMRTLFYDNPRFAGYAYHLMIIFTIVMNLNFYLVGPLITVGILIYLNIKSYRQFKN